LWNLVGVSTVKAWAADKNLVEFVRAS